MRPTVLALASIFLLGGTSFAAEPTGEWRVAGGDAQIRIENCGDRMWGVVAWEKDHGVDAHNPNSAKRGRPTLAMPIVLGMAASKPGLWVGEIYNSQNGKNYSGSIKLASADTLRIEGCVLGFLCGGENWTRVSVDASKDALALSTEEFCTKLIGSDTAPLG